MYKKLKKIAKDKELKKIIEEFEEQKPTEEQKEFFAAFFFTCKFIKTMEYTIKMYKEIKEEENNEKNDK